MYSKSRESTQYSSGAMFKWPWKQLILCTFASPFSLDYLSMKIWLGPFRSILGGGSHFLSPEAFLEFMSRIVGGPSTGCYRKKRKGEFCRGVETQKSRKCPVWKATNGRKVRPNMLPLAWYTLQPSAIISVIMYNAWIDLNFPTFKYQTRLAIT